MTAADNARRAEAVSLSPLAPDAVRSDRTRARCVAVLSARARRRARRQQALSAAADTLTPWMITAGALLYAVTLIVNAVRLKPLMP